MENLYQKDVDSSMKKNFFTIILLGIFTSNLFADTVTCTKLSDCLNQGYKMYEKKHFNHENNLFTLFSLTKGQERVFCHLFYLDGMIDDYSCTHF